MSIPLDNIIYCKFIGFGDVEVAAHSALLLGVTHAIKESIKNF